MKRNSVLYAIMSPDMTNQCLLRRFRKSDIPILLDWLKGTDSVFLRQFSGSGFSWPLTLEQMERELDGQEESVQVTLLYIDTDDTPLGICQLRGIHTLPGSARIARVLIAPKERGRGLGRRMLQDVMDWGKGAYGLSSYTLLVFDFNSSARRCYEGMGFGVVESYKKKIEDLGQIWSGVIMQKDLTD